MIATNTHPREWFWPRNHGTFFCRYCGGEFPARARNQRVCSGKVCQWKADEAARERAKQRQRSKKENRG